MAVKKIHAKSGLVFKITFYCLFIISLIIGVVYTNTVLEITGDRSDSVRFIEGWTVTDSSGKSFETGRTYYDERAFDEDFTLTARLPDKISLDNVLCFQNRSNVRVYVNGELRRSFDKYKDTGIPGGSMKEFYMTVPLSPEDSGGELKLLRARTDYNPELVSETIVGTEAGVYAYMTSKYGLSFALSAVLFVASLLAAAVALIMRIWNRKRMEMLYAALGILDVSCWLLAVSQYTPFITGIYYIDGLMGFLFCMLIPLPFIIYINYIQKSRYRGLYCVLFWVSVINFIVWTALHFSGVILFQAAMPYIDSVLGIVVVIVIMTLIADIRNGHIKDYLYTAMGFLVFMIMSIVEIIGLVILQNDLYQLSMIFGLMSFLVFVIFQQVDDIRKVRSALEQEVSKRTLENEQMLIHIVQTLAGTIDAKDTYTKGHSGRVADYAREIAKRCGYDEAAQNDIYMMGLLHDIGKIGVPDAVINKPGRLTDEEFEIIKKHPVMGARILGNIKEKQELSVGARWHHEKYGGGGYPDGIKGEDIPEQARIIAVADAYDAMTSYRSYRDPMPQSKVRDELEKGRGTQFDPRFADIMLEMISEDKDYKLRENNESDNT